MAEFWKLIKFFFSQLFKSFKTKPVQQEEPAPEVKKPTGDTEPSWMTLARKEIGTKEVWGPGDNQRVIEYHSVTTLKATDDSVPWCSSFACWVMEHSGIRSPRSARARDWVMWGKSLQQPKPGCIVVFSRDGGGHVAFFVREEGDSLVVLGGNQGDKVCEAKYPKARVLAYRWPA